MRRLTQRDKVCVFILCALMLMHNTEGEQNRTVREYFIQNRSLSWNEARNHCKVCFKELVTLTPDNIQIIAQKLTSDSWIGLRKNFYHTSNSSSNYSGNYNSNNTSNSSMPWTHWSNGDPFTFQNWYPGWPVLKSSSKNPSCCSCSCTCPGLTTPRPTSFTTRQTEFTTQTSFTSVPDFNMTNLTSFTSVPDLNVTNITSFTSVPDLNTTDITSFTSVPDINITSTTRLTSVTDQNVLDFTTMTPPLPVEGECVCSPMLLHADLEPDENYIEDSCVAMLSFGAWVEKSCSELLQFICYEDRFFGHVNVTNVTSSSVSLSWLPAPDGISHYRVEVRNLYTVMTETKTNLTIDLFNLTAGTLYFVQVIPVKCERDLNPQEVSFYTIPNEVTNLTVTSVTETSVFLMWNKPAGNLDFYLIEVDDKQNHSNTEATVVDGLMPGNLYIFTVRTGVQQNNTFSEGSSISTYTKPGKVANLSVSENTNISLLLSWRPPEGHTTSFWVQAVNDSNGKLFDEVINFNSTQTQQQVKVTGLPTGTRITLSVTALVNGTLKGDKVTIVNYTAPGPISNLSLQTTDNSLNATWTPSPGSFSSFTVILQLDGETVDKIEGLTEPGKKFVLLKTAANYTVIVYSVSGHLHSPPVKSSKFTLPNPPTDAQVVFSSKSQITFQWKAPENTVRPGYVVCLSSSFWGRSWSSKRIDQTTYTFDNLTSGTNYTFQVRTVTGEAQSPPLTTSHFTESENMEIGLSMMCSSTELLLCANHTSEENVFHQLQAHFSQSLGNAIYWSLEKQQRENTLS